MILASLLSLVAFVLCQYKWTGAFAYEFNFIFGIASFGLYFFDTIRRDYLGKSSLSKQLLSLLYLIFPLLVVLIYPQKIRTCDYAVGAYWFLLLPLVSSFFGISSAIFGCALGRGTKSKIFFGLLPSIVFAALVVCDFYFRPSLFFFHPALGYFPGPLYDEWIPILPKVITFRAWTMALSLWMLSIAALQNRKTWLTLGILLLLPLLFRSWLGWNYSHQDVRSALGRQLSASNVHLHFHASTFRENEAQVYLKSLVFYVDDISNRFRIEAKDRRPMHVYIYPDPKTKYELTGARHTAIGHPFHRVVHLLKEPAYRSILPHELTHVVSSHFGPWPFRINFNEALLEGLATAMEGYRGKLSIHEWAVAMKKMNMLPDLNKLLGPGTFLSQAPFRAYLASGSFCLWLIENDGAQKFTEFYREGKFEKIYGVPISSRIKAWESFLLATDLSKEDIIYAQDALSAKPIFERTCVHDVADAVEKSNACSPKLSDCRRSYLKIAWDFSGQEPGYGLSLIHEAIVRSEWNEARALLGVLLEKKNLVDTDRFRTLLFKADLDVLEGNFAEALQGYSQLLQEPLPTNFSKIVSVRKQLLAQEERQALHAWIQKNEASGVVTSLLRSSPSAAQDYFESARVQEAASDFAKAEKSYLSAMELAQNQGQRMQAKVGIARMRYLQLGN